MQILQPLLKFFGVLKVHSLHLLVRRCNSTRTPQINLIYFDIHEKGKNEM